MKGTVVHDLSKTTGVIAESVGVMEANGDDAKPTVVSRALFTRAQDGGYAEAFDEIETDAKFSSMARIEFPHKMVNPFMTYRSRFWPVVLGISQKEFEGIVHCRLVWDRVEERLVDSRTVTQIKGAIERYSICGAALLDYLEKVQPTIEDKYKQELIKLVFKPSSRYNVYDAISIFTESLLQILCMSLMAGT